MIRRLQTYIGQGTDPYRNLALEEYLTATVPEDTCILYLWQNQHTVVIGRNQNAWQECRTTLLEQEGGALARRLSGGGAVYHDLGNLNFTFCLRSADYDLHRQQSVIVEACRRLGIRAAFSGRNDILAEGRKFSGNSFYSHNGRSFHNGTLLLNVDMASLGKYLNPSQVKLESKGVASVRSRVINLCDLKPALTTELMCQAKTEAFAKVYGLSPAPHSAEHYSRPALEPGYARFRSKEWNYGRSVPITFQCAARFDWGEITLQLDVSDGLCAAAAVYTDALDESFAQPLAQRLQGCRFSVSELCRAVRSVPACAAAADDICGLLLKQDI